MVDRTSPTAPAPPPPPPPPSPLKKMTVDAVVARNRTGALDEQALARDLRQLPPAEQQQAIRALQAQRAFTPVETGNVLRLFDTTALTRPEAAPLPLRFDVGRFDQRLFGLDIVAPDRAAALDRWMATQPSPGDIRRVMEGGTSVAPQLAADLTTASFRDAVRQAGRIDPRDPLAPTGKRPSLLRDPCERPDPLADFRRLLDPLSNGLAGRPNLLPPSDGALANRARDGLAPRQAELPIDRERAARDDLAMTPDAFAASIRRPTAAQRELLVTGAGALTDQKLSPAEARYVLDAMTQRWAARADRGAAELQMLSGGGITDPGTRRVLAQTLADTAGRDLGAGRIDRATLIAADRALALGGGDDTLGTILKTFGVSVDKAVDVAARAATENPAGFREIMKTLATHPETSPTRDAIAEGVFLKLSQDGYREPTSWLGLRGGGPSRDNALAVGRALSARGEGWRDQSAVEAGGARFADVMAGRRTPNQGEQPYQAEALLADPSAPARARLWAADMATRSDASADDLATRMGPWMNTDGWRRAAVMDRYLADAAPVLQSYSPAEIGALAQQINASKVDLRNALPLITAQPESQQRDTLIKSVFLATNSERFSTPFQRPPDVQTGPQVDAWQRGSADAMGAALARSILPAGDPRLPQTERNLGEFLNNDAGRRLLLKEWGTDGVPAASRLNLARVAAENPGLIRDALADADYRSNPWENPRLLDPLAQATFAQPANRVAPTTYTGGQLDNLVGLSLNGKPSEEAQRLDRAGVVGAIDRGQSLYAGDENVARVTAAIRATANDLGVGEAARISAVPIQFSSQATGPVDLKIFKVEGNGGQVRYVDNTGARYDNFIHWQETNKLPVGTMTFPVSGGTRTEGTPTVRSAATPESALGRRVLATLDNVALVGGTVAGVALLVVGTGGTAGVALVGVALGSALYTAGRGAETLYDRSTHAQSLSLADPDARAAWLDTAAAALPVAGAGLGATSRIARLGLEARSALAVTAGVTNFAGMSANMIAVGNGAYQIADNWNEMTPAERTKGVLQTMFSAGMLGAQVKMSHGGAGDLVDPRLAVRRALLDSGVNTHVNPELNGIVVSREGRSVRIDAPPDASPMMMRVHEEIAQQMITNSGAVAQLRYAMSKNGKSFAPGSRGEGAMLEVAKHQRIVSLLESDLSAGRVAAADRPAAQVELDQYRIALRGYELELATMRTDPRLAAQPGTGDVWAQKTPNRAWLGLGPDAVRAASADVPMTQLTGPLSARYPQARPLVVVDGMVDIPGVGQTNKLGLGAFNIERFTRAQDQGGLGGSLFYDPVSKNVIAAINMTRSTEPNMVRRVEVPYARDATTGEWRADFSRYARFSTRIPADLPRNEKVHFEAANIELKARLADPNLPPLDLGLTDKGQQAIDRSGPSPNKKANPEGSSPEPYTWHHVNGNGDIILVDAAIHALFSHKGGFSEWSAGGTRELNPTSTKPR